MKICVFSDIHGNYDVEKCKLNILRLDYPRAKKYVSFLE